MDVVGQHEQMKTWGRAAGDLMAQQSQAWPRLVGVGVALEAPPAWSQETVAGDVACTTITWPAWRWAEAPCGHEPTTC